MIWFRLIFGLLLLATLVCFGLYMGTKNPAWRRLGIIILKWTLLAAAGFFGVLLVQRLPQLF